MKLVRRRLLIHEKEVEWLPPRQVIVLIMTEMVSEHLYKSSWAFFFDDAVLLMEIFLSRCYPMTVLGRCLLIRSAGAIIAAASSKLLFLSSQVLMMIGEVVPPEPAAASKNDMPRVQYTTDQHTAGHRVA